MNIWAIVAVLAALIFGFCMGYITANWRENKSVTELRKLYSETDERLRQVSEEYDEFVKAAHEVDRWPRYISDITLKDNLADYLRAKYMGDGDDGNVSEDEVDNLYV